MIRFDLRYLLCTVVLFFTEVLIAAYMHDNFIRPTFGDYLVVILMYCGLRTFIAADYRIMVVATLLFNYAVEVSQYFHLIVHLGLQHSTVAQWILGTGFAWGDMLAYTLGAISIWVVERRRSAEGGRG